MGVIKGLKGSDTHCKSRAGQSGRSTEGRWQVELYFRFASRIGRSCQTRHHSHVCAADMAEEIAVDVGDWEEEF
jgi:hypothetical protein